MIQNSELMKGIAPAIILKLLSKQSMYGYEMIRTINELTNGEFQWKEGALYPCLHKMENDGLLRSEWKIVTGKPRKYYMLTRTGKQAVEEKVNESRTFCTALSHLLCFE